MDKTRLQMSLTQCVNSQHLEIMRESLDRKLQDLNGIVISPDRQLKELLLSLLKDNCIKVVPEANLAISDCVNFLRPGRSHLNETVCQVSSPGSYAFPRYKREKFCFYGPFRGKNKGDILRFRWFRATKEIPKDFVGDRCVDIITKTKHDIPWTSKLTRT